MKKNKSSTAPIAFINRLRINVDGKGIRTLVGFYGCPLKCKYCINPKTWSYDYTPKQYTIEQLLHEVEIDNLYFQSSKGGITFGGGEPLLYPDFIKAFIDIANNEWTYYMETSLNVPWENVEKVIDDIDVFIIDIKTINNEIYQAYTSKDNSLVLDNLKKLMEEVYNHRIIVRLPFIEGYTSINDYEESYYYLKSLGIKNIDKFKYIKR